MQKVRVLYLALLFFAGIASAGYAFGQVPGFKTVGTRDGLNNGTINSMCQDEHGNIWMATWDGVLKYNGNSVVTYLPVLGDSTSLPARRATRVMSDSKGNIWCLTTRGICRYNPSFDNYIRYSLDHESDTRTVPQGIFELDRTIYIRNNSDILYYLPLDSIYVKREFQPAVLNGIPGGTVSRMLSYDLMDGKAVLLCKRFPDNSGSQGSRVYLVRSSEGRTGHLDAEELFFSPKGIFVLQSDGEDRIYAGTRSGLYVFYHSGNQLMRVPGTTDLNISDLMITGNNRLWIATNRNGLAALDLHTGQLQRYLHDPGRANTIAGNVIYSLFQDFSGSLWIGHAGEGISILNLLYKPFETFRMNPNLENSLSDNTVFCFNQSRREILIGTNYDGLNVMRTSQQSGEATFTRIEFPRDFTDRVRFIAVWHIATESPGRFWMGTNFGLIHARRREGAWSFERYLEQENTGTIRQV